MKKLVKNDSNRGKLGENIQKKWMKLTKKGIKFRKKSEKWPKI